MSRKKTNTAKENEPIVDNITQRVVEDGKKIAKEDFAKFSAIAAAIFSAGLWVIKSMWYAYWSGKLSVYKVDNCYISADNENIFLQIMQLASIFVVWFLVNYIYYKISVAEDGSRLHWKRKSKKLAFWIVEMMVVVLAVSFFNHTHLGELIGEITVGNIVAHIIVLFILCLMINIYAIEFLIEERLKKKKAPKTNIQENKKKNKKRIKDMFILVIATIAIELIIVFTSATQIESSRCGYKLIMVQSEDAMESEFDIEYEKDNSKYEMYPVVYENQDCYIVTRLYNENGKIKIDYNYQRIIQKNGQETVYVDNVYEISGDN